MIVGLTGGIGSGKTTVAGFFKKLGIPVYIADHEAKRLMVISPEIRSEIIQLLGEEAYAKDDLNRTYIADIVFKNKQLLAQLNAIVHPRVAVHFNHWYQQQDSPYVIKEAAILFENGGYKDCDFIITVTAPIKKRIERVKKRDHSSDQEIQNRINAQWHDSKKIALSDVAIENTYLDKTEEKVVRIHNHLVLRIRRNW